jgi:hypothetical protein
MSAHGSRRSRARVALWLSIGAGVAILFAANWHLVHVAMSSQPECVAHLRLGDADPVRGAFSAARSACTPQPSNDGLSGERGAP